MNKFLGFILGAFLAITPALAQINNPPPVYNTPGGAPQLDSYTQTPRSQISYAATKLVPVCNTQYVTDFSTLTTGNQFNSSFVLRCPRGVKSLAALLAGFYAIPAETSLTNPIPINIGIWANSPGPWKPTTTYTVGQMVFYADAPTTDPVLWQATGTNLNSPPNGVNANWTAGTVPTNSYIPVTCQGSRGCVITTQSTPAGSLVAQAVTQTNLVTASVPVGGYIQIKLYGVTSGAQQFVNGLTIMPRLGQYARNLSTLTDYSVATASANTYQGYQAGFAPLAVIGVPLVDGPTLCIVSHSIGGGSNGAGFLGTGTLSAGGTGYTTADIGVPFDIPNTGAGSAAVGATAQWTIDSISAGVVSTIRLWDGGAYGNTARNGANSTPPSGAQTVVAPALHGTGLIITPPSTLGGYDYGDSDGYRGYLPRAGNAQNIPFTSITRSSDSASQWLTRDYNRLAAINASGCSTVVMDLSVNDMGSGAVALEGYTTALASQFQGLTNVKQVVVTTSGPNATSTNGFINITQTPINTTAYQAFNAWLPGQANAAGPINCTIDPYAVVTSSANSNLWAFDGTINKYTTDGIHPNTYSYGVLATAAGAPLLACMK